MTIAQEYASWVLEHKDANATSTLSMIERAEVVDREGLRALVNGMVNSLPLHPDFKRNPTMAAGDAILVALLFGARLGKKGLL